MQLDARSGQLISPVVVTLSEYRLVAALVVLWNDADKLLLVRTSRNPDWWQPVGGRAASGEGGLDTAIREVREEVGVALNAVSMRLVTVVLSDEEPGVVEVFEYEEVVEIAYTEPRILETRWVALQEAAALPMRSACQQIIATLIRAAACRD